MQPQKPGSPKTQLGLCHGEQDTGDRLPKQPHSDPAAIEILHRYARETYDQAVIEAAAAIVAREVSDWYRRAMPEEFGRIASAIADWRRWVEAP